MENNQSNKFKKVKSILNEWWIWVIISALIVCVGVGVIGKEKTKDVINTKAAAASTKSTASSSNSSSNTTSTQSKNKTYKVGETVELKDYKITVNNVYILAPTDTYAPKDGNEFFAINCTIENNSKEQQTISSMMMFKVIDDQGKECKYSLTGLSAAKEKQLEGNLPAGGKLTGIYVVEVQKGKTGLKLEFDKILVDSNQTVIQLN